MKIMHSYRFKSFHENVLFSHIFGFVYSRYILEKCGPRRSQRTLIKKANRENCQKHNLLCRRWNVRSNYYGCSHFEGTKVWLQVWRRSSTSYGHFSIFRCIQGELITFILPNILYHTICTYF